MTLAEVNSAVDSYFTAHLDSEYWRDLEAEKKLGAVAMALDDILSILNVTLERVTPDSAAVKAVAEQAVYLSRNYESIAEGKITTSESVEGVSAGYTLIGSNYGISPRAETFIKQSKREFFGGSVRVMRG